MTNKDRTAIIDIKKKGVSFSISASTFNLPVGTVKLIFSCLKKIRAEAEGTCPFMGKAVSSFVTWKEEAILLLPPLQLMVTFCP